MPKYRGSRKNYNVPSNPRLFTISTGASSGGDICPRNAAGERVSEAGPSQGPLIGGPRDADGFLKKLYDDEWKDVIYKTMDFAERQFAIEFMKNDKPAPPGSPNACLSKYERAIIATFNNITTEEMNGDIHIDELLKREAGKTPIRLPKDPLILPGVAAPKRPTKIVAPQVELPKLDDLKKAAGATSGGGIGDLEPPLFEGPEPDLRGFPEHSPRVTRKDQNNKLKTTSPFLPTAMVSGVGQRFDSMDEAAIAFFKAASEVNQRIDKGLKDGQPRKWPPELGGSLFAETVELENGSEETKFYYIGMQRGLDSEVTMQPFTDAVAFMHTHPPGEKGTYDIENRELSDTDVKGAQRRNVPYYLATPQGDILVFQPTEYDDGKPVKLGFKVKY